jgi:hypothetical protein
MVIMVFLTGDSTDGERPFFRSRHGVQAILQATAAHDTSGLELMIL